MEEIINFYKEKILEQLRILAGTSILNAGGKSMKIVSVISYNNININKIIISISDANNNSTVNIPIQVGIARHLSSIRMSIHFLQNGAQIYGTSMILAQQDIEQESMILRFVSYNVARGNIPAHYHYWWGANNAELQGDFRDLRINLRGLTISIIKERYPEYETISIEDTNAEEEKESIRSYIKLQAKSIAIRCADWILYQAITNNPSIDIIDSLNQNIGQNRQITEFLSINPNNHEIIEINGLTTRSINPFNLKEECMRKGLYYSDDIYQIISTSINLGHHLILTGPPGCGKSKLAEIVGEMLGNENPPKIVTASPSWTSGEIVGRYFPRPDDGKLLFHPGVFLQASEEDQCLIIDEMNRANIDECMGELFTVLAGQSVDLPYMDTIDDSDDNLENYGHVKIIPHKEEIQPYPTHAVYRVKSGFRLIGTMNDSDRSALHNLSFALLRRFDVVRIKPPSIDNIITIIRNSTTVDQVANFTLANNNDPKIIIQNELELIAKNIFYPDQGFGLIKNQITGTSSMTEVIKFSLGSMSANNFPNGTTINTDQLTLKRLVRSIFSLGLLVKVVPQLDAIDEEKFEQTIEKIKISLDSIHESRYSYTCKFNNIISIHEYTHETISKHFLNEIKYHYQNTSREEYIEQLMNG